METYCGEGLPKGIKNIICWGSSEDLVSAYGGTASLFDLISNAGKLSHLNCPQGEDPLAIVARDYANSTPERPRPRSESRLLHTMMHRRQPIYSSTEDDIVEPERLRSTCLQINRKWLDIMRKRSWRGDPLDDNVQGTIDDRLNQIPQRVINTGGTWQREMDYRLGAPRGAHGSDPLPAAENVA